MEKIKTRLKAKQRKPGRRSLWLLAYLSFVVSSFYLLYGVFKICAKYCINFYLCKKKLH